MININRMHCPVGLRGNVRWVLPVVAVVAATMLAGCVAYPYPGGQGYYQAHPDYHPYYAAQPANPGHWNAGWQ